MSEQDAVRPGELWLLPPGSWTEAVDLVGPLAKLLPAGEKRLQALAQVAAERNDGFAAYEIGTHLANGPDLDDLGKAWHWIAASLGCRQGCLAMAEAVLARADAAGPLFGRELAPLALHWLRLAESGFRIDPFGTLLNAPDRKPAQRGSAEAAAKEGGRSPEPAAPPPPTHRPVAVIGAATSGEGRALHERWKPLTTDLPLLGGDVDPDWLEARLVEEMPWAREAARAIADDLRLVRLSGRPHFWVRPTLLVGPPGVGKTHFLTRLAGLAGLPWSLLNLGGASDNRLLMGTARGWASTQPAYPLVAMLAGAPCANPLVVVDEVDKASADRRNGSAWDALLAYLEPASARHLFDDCLLARADVSTVSWCMTANDPARLPASLLSRLAVVRIDRPRAEHFDVLLDGLRRDLAAALRLADVRLLPELAAGDVAWLRRVFNASGYSVRVAKRAFERLVALRGRDEAAAKARPN